MILVVFSHLPPLFLPLTPPRLLFNWSATWPEHCDLKKPTHQMILMFRVSSASQRFSSNLHLNPVVRPDAGSFAEVRTNYINSGIWCKIKIWNPFLKTVKNFKTVETEYGDKHGFLLGMGPWSQGINWASPAWNLVVILKRFPSFGLYFFFHTSLLPYSGSLSTHLLLWLHYSAPPPAPPPDLIWVVKVVLRATWIVVLSSISFLG